MLLFKIKEAISWNDKILQMKLKEVFRKRKPGN